MDGCTWKYAKECMAYPRRAERLTEHGYYPVQHTPGLWRHKWRPVNFTLAVDDFGVKITGEKHGEHL
eukprot:88489-Ditylum_brightwellii.AAC.1